MAERVEPYLRDLILRDFEKEYFCHLQFVDQIGIELATRYLADIEVVSLACKAHDIGRGRELPGEDHNVTSVRILQDILKVVPSDLGVDRERLVLQCVYNHGAIFTPRTLEEKIVITADGASKVLHHEAFMLMCKREGFRERAIWGMKYLERGFGKIVFPEYKEELREKYESLKSIYLSVLRSE